MTEPDVAAVGVKEHKNDKHKKTEHQEDNRTTSPRNAVADPIDQRVTSDSGPIIKLV